MGQLLFRQPTPEETEKLIRQADATELLLQKLEELNIRYLNILETLQRNNGQASERFDRIERKLDTLLSNASPVQPADIDEQQHAEDCMDSSNTVAMSAPTEDADVVQSGELTSTSSDQLNEVFISTAVATTAVAGSYESATDTDDEPREQPRDTVDTSPKPDCKERRESFVTEQGHPVPRILYGEMTDLQKIGEGNGCTVFRGNHPTLGVIAYKQLGPCVLQSESKQARKLKHEVVAHFIRHTNVVETLGMVFQREHHGILMEYVKYGNMDEFLHKYITVGWFMLMSFARDVACGLEQLHNMTTPAVHGDIKLKNVLIGEGLVAKIGDFGLSKWNAFSTKYSPSTKPLSVTTTHVPPERWLDINAPRTPACDVYGYGVLLWEMFSRSTPFAEIAGKPTEISLAVTNGHRPPIDAIRGRQGSSMPHAMFELTKPYITQCWSTEAECRPQIIAVRLEFDQFLTANQDNLKREKDELELATAGHV